MTTRADPDRLHVWHAGRRVGALWRDRQDRIGFEYHPDWIDDGFPVGHVLPLRPKPFEPQDGLAHAWFSNLLPEGAARERIVRSLGVADDDFVLLREISGDCAGALNILPIDQPVPEQGGAEPLDARRFERMLKQRGQDILPRPAPDDPAAPRLNRPDFAGGSSI